MQSFTEKFRTLLGFFKKFFITENVTEILRKTFSSNSGNISFSSLSLISFLPMKQNKREKIRD